MANACLLVELKEAARGFSVITTEGKCADSNDIAHAARIFGVTSGGRALAGQMREVHAWGQLTNLNWCWRANDVIYLNGTQLSTVPPETGFVLRVGCAINDHTIRIDLGEPVIL